MRGTTERLLAHCIAQSVQAAGNLHSCKSPHSFKGNSNDELLFNPYTFFEVILILVQCFY